MDFRQLEAFVATVDHQSFSGAAEAMYLSQPTISSHIHSLERELHAQLIRRTTKRFEVTQEGQLLYEYAVAMLRLQQKAFQELSNAGTRDLHIGVSSVPGRCILPPVLAGYHTVAPEVSIHITHAQSMDVIQKVEAGTLDVGIVGMKTEARCLFEPIATDEMVLVIPTTPYYQSKYGPDASVKAILREPVILRTGESGTQREADAVLESLKINEKELNVVARVNDAEAQRSYVVQGLGVSVVSYRMVQEQERQGKLRVFHLGSFTQPRKFYLIFQEGPYLPKAAETFIRYLRELHQKQAL